MGPPTDTRIDYLASAKGALPEAAARPWTKVGAGVVSIVADGFQVADASAVTRTLYYRQANPVDPPTTPPRSGQVLAVQLRVRVVSFSAWVTSTSPAGIILSDGGLAVALSIGDSLRLVNPSTGALLIEASKAWSWQRSHVYELRKDESTAWELWVDGALLATLPYDAAPSTPGLPTSTTFTTSSAAYYAFGCLDTTSTATAVFDVVETGTGLELPPQWKVDRFEALLPAAMVNRWTEVSEAFVRAFIGLVEGAIRGLDGVKQALRAGRYDEEAASFSGAALPSAENPAWTLLHSADVSILRERVHVAAGGADLTGARFDFTAVSANPKPEHAVGATLTVRSYTPDGAARVGPHVRIADGTKAAVLQLLETAAGTAWAWVLTSDATTGGAATELGRRWPVYVLDEPSRVDLYLFAPDWALVVVDGEVVDQVAYSTLSNSGNHNARVAVDVGPVCTVDVEDGIAARRTTDLRRRPLFEQVAIERGLLLGGCERNDLLQVVSTAHFEVQKLRGTDAGILAELRRMTCSSEPAIEPVSTPTDWYLDVTYPDITPIWLDSDGFLIAAYVESPAIRTLTLDAFAAWVVRYLFPISTVEFTYLFCLATPMTAPTSVPWPGLTQLTVESTVGFVAGDAVQVRDAANTIVDDAVVDSVVSDVLINVTTVTPEASGVLRKVLATS